MINLYIILVMVLCIFDIKSPAIYLFIGQSFYYNRILWILSKKFNFCLWHRILIFNMSIALVMEVVYNLGVKINYYLYICILFTFVSLVLSSILYYKNGCFIKKDHNKSI